MSNLDSVRSVYDAFAKGDIQTVLNFLSWTLSISDL